MGNIERLNLSKSCLCSMGINWYHTQHKSLKRRKIVVELHWDETAVSDSVTLADYIEMAISLDVGHKGFAFTWDDFVDHVKEEPFDGNFLEGEEIDELAEYFENAVALVECRRKWFGELYPFTTEDGSVQLSPLCESSSWTPYIFLLACSHDHSPHKSPRMESEFEKICKEAFKSLLSDDAYVFLFSRGSDDRARIGNSARKALSKLAELLNADIVRPDDEIPDTPREFGIDIIAIDKMHDNLGYSLLMTAQCTVSGDPKQWESKKTEPQWGRSMGHFIPYEVPSVVILFIPHLPRLQSGVWSVPAFIFQQCIVCDRYRICKMLQRRQQHHQEDASAAVSEIIDGFIGRDGSKLTEGNLI